MRFFSFLAALVSAVSMLGYTSAQEPTFAHLNWVFNVLIITDSSFKLDYNLQNGFEFTGDKAFCEKAMNYAQLELDPDGVIQKSRPYKILYTADASRTTNKNVLRCPGTNDTVCYVQKMEENRDVYEVYVLKSEKLSVLASTSEVDRKYKD